MNGRLHWGANGVKVCGESPLLVEQTTQDLQAITCTRCLWKLLADVYASMDRIAMRIKVVTDEERASLVAVRQ